VRSASDLARGAALAAVAALVTGAMACRTPVSSDRLEGRWIGIRAEGPGADGVAGANAFATGVELEFRRNEIFVTSSRQSQAGRYEVVKDDPSAIVITTDRDGPGHPQTFSVHDDDTLRWNVLPGRALVFARE
jgi:hypothetical protein